MEHWNYSGLPPVERFNEAVDRANELLAALREVITNGRCVNGQWAISGNVYAMAQNTVAEAEGDHMDPHDDFDKHDRPPYDIAPATNTPYREVVKQRDELLSALKLVVSAGALCQREHPYMWDAWQAAIVVIRRVEGR